jgi:hypothetical protein
LRWNDTVCNSNTLEVLTTLHIAVLDSARCRHNMLRMLKLTQLVVDAQTLSHTLSMTVSCIMLAAA